MLAEDPPPDQDVPTPAGPAGPAPCSACRGTGTVISNLGGTPSPVPCPWCNGGGARLHDHDAQASRRGEVGEGAGNGDTPAAPSTPEPGDQPSGGEPPPAVA